MGCILTLVHEPGSCDRSLDYAVGLALAQRAELQVLHVLPPIPPIPADPIYNVLGRKRYRELLRSQAEAYFGRVGLCIPESARGDLVVHDGNLVKAAAGVAAHLKPHLITISEPVLRAWSSLFRRRVLDRLAHATGVPVLFVPEVPGVREFTCLHCPPGSEASAAPKAA
jgi:hypothetical protein